MNNQNGIIPGINVDAVDLYDYAFDNIDEEELAEEIKNLKIAHEEPKMSSNQISCSSAAMMEEKMDMADHKKGFLGGIKNQQIMGGQSEDLVKRKLIQQQLVLLLHAHKCQQRAKPVGVISVSLRH